MIALQPRRYLMVSNLLGSRRSEAELTSSIPIKMGAIMAVKSIVAVLCIALASTAEASAQTQAPLAGTYDVSDEGLVKSLPGFISSFATVNGIRLHYVAGGKGSPVLLLPGWPETCGLITRSCPTGEEASRDRGRPERYGEFR
jgi:hypothetical protein